MIYEEITEKNVIRFPHHQGKSISEQKFNEICLTLHWWGSLGVIKRW